MYSRSYITDSRESITPPENYDGNAFIEPRVTQNHTVAVTHGEMRSVGNDVREETVSECTAEPASTSVGGSVLTSLLGRWGGISPFRMPKIGTEEILIIATALFLFLSKEGDRECAIMLLLLLVIN